MDNLLSENRAGDEIRTLPQVMACILPVLQRMTEAVALGDVCRCKVYYSRNVYQSFPLSQHY
jgi:hypothetical protein